MSTIKIPFSEFTFTFSRSSGAGGQNVNKVNSKVTLYWAIDKSPTCPFPVLARFKAKYSHYILDNGEVQIVSQKTRNQKDNIADCIEKLHALLKSVEKAPIPRKKTKPKKSAIQDRLTSKKINSDKKKSRQERY